jgi:ankyrin repeat protein
MTILDVFRGSGNRNRVPTLKLAKQGRYDEMKRSLLHESDVKTDNWIRLVDPKGETALHMILKYQTPVEIVHRVTTIVLDVFRSSGKRNRVPILKLAKGGRYDEMKKLLLQENDVKTDNWIRLVDPKGETALHMILKYQPPVEIVHLIIMSLAKKTNIAVPEEVRDAEGKTPLHVAVTYECHPDVVHRLLNGVGGVIPAVTKDREDRLPLHLACLGKACGATSAKQLSQQPTQKQVDNMVQVVYLLLSAYPIAAVLRDSKGETPLDLARRNGADGRILRVLTISAELHAHIFNPSYTVAAAAKPGKGTVSSEGVPTEITSSLSHDGDDLSSIGVGGLSTVQGGPKNLARIEYFPESIVMESEHGNSLEVLEKCWFV